MRCVANDGSELIVTDAAICINVGSNAKTRRSLAKIRLANIEAAIKKTDIKSGAEKSSV